MTAGAGRETGNSHFKTGRSQGMTDGKYGENKLIDAHPFRTHSLCQEYLIKEAQKFDQKT